jgi:hypothetical protein
LRIASKLRECGVDVEHAMRSHQLAIFDAEPMLGEICSSGKPDQAVFNRIATQAAQTTGLHFSRILIFGEMVGMLTARGDPESAILFEQWCNECLLGATDVQMFCAYPRSPEMTAQVYETVCCAHTAVL